MSCPAFLEIFLHLEHKKYFINGGHCKEQVLIR